jgi:CBS domain-containing protein
MAAALDAGRSEIARFLAQRAPFDALAAEELGELVAQTEIEFHLAGAAILTEDGGPVTFLRVIHSGAVDISHGGNLLDLLGPGDTFGHAAMMAGLPPGFEARAAEDTLCYRVPVAVARPLLDQARSQEIKVGSEPGHRAVIRLIRSPTVRCQPDATVGEMARRMTELGTNSAVVDLGERGFGIVTDRDVRSRIVAAGLDFSAPVSAVMSVPVVTVPPERLAGEAMFEMLERGIRHLVVVDEEGELVGVVQDSDLFAVQPSSWFGARRAIARAKNIDALAEAAARVPEIVLDLHSSNVRAIDVARILSALTDALTVRVLELSATAGGLPSDGLVWVALGSQARREMTPASIAHGALVCSDPPPPDWLQSLGDAMVRCRLPRPPAARSGREWLDADYDDEIVLTVLSERRPLWGTPREPLPVLAGDARERAMAALARRALAYQPPTGFDAEAVLEADGTRSTLLDIRRAAVIPIVELARWAGAAAGLTAGSTDDRVRAAADEGVLSHADATTLSDAFELALELRVSHHMRRMAEGEAPDDRIEPAEISPLMRDHLRDVFRAVTTVQRGLVR